MLRGDPPLSSTAALAARGRSEQHLLVLGVGRCLWMGPHELCWASGGGTEWEPVSGHVPAPSPAGSWADAFFPWPPPPPHLCNGNFLPALSQVLLVLPTASAHGSSEVGLQ